MLSRVADSAYWMSRYLERAEHAARVGDVCLSLSLDGPSDAARRLLPTLGAPPAGYGVRARAHNAYAHAAVVSAPIDSIVACVSAARENARQIREQISSEMWEQLNRLYLFVRQERRRRDSASTFDFFRAVKEGSHLFQGLTDATMTHGEGWHFIQLGRCLERAGATAALLDAHLGGVGPGQAAQEIGTLVEWVALLRSCAAFEAYCRCYTADIRPARVAEFLLLNAESPRSVRFAIDRVELSLRAIARHAGKTSAGRVDRLAGRLQASLDFSQIDEILAASLHAFVQDVRQQGDLVHAALFETYISYPTESAIAS